MSRLGASHSSQFQYGIESSLGVRGEEITKGIDWVLFVAVSSGYSFGQDIGLWDQDVLAYNSVYPDWIAPQTAGGFAPRFFAPEATPLSDLGFFDGRFGARTLTGILILRSRSDSGTSNELAVFNAHFTTDMWPRRIWYGWQASMGPWQPFVDHVNNNAPPGTEINIGFPVSDAWIGTLAFRMRQMVE